jgi:Potassium-transporting ATPase A subunit/Transcriptional regulatory protein, C terminal
MHRKDGGARRKEAEWLRALPRVERKTTLYVLVFPLVILCGAAWSAVAPYALPSLNNAGPHALSEILYAYTSTAGNNGSAFAGINANTPWWNVSLGLAMLIGRFWMIVPALAIAGIMAGKKAAPPGTGTLPTTGPLFTVLLVGVRNAGKVLTHRHLLKEVWGAAYASQTHYLRVYMAQLRHKLEPDPNRPRFLVTEPGVGYRLRSE